MSTKQTTIQEINSIRKGSVKVLIGDDFDSLVDIGALRSAVFESMGENQEIAFDNVDSLKKFVNGKKVHVTFDLAEINFTNMAKLDGGILELTPIAATLVSGEEQTVASGAWEYGKFIKIEHQNGNGSLIDVNSVSGSVDGSLTPDVDFVVMQNENSEYGIMVLTPGSPAGVTTEAQILTINYDYTPNASKKLTFNDSGTKSLICMRLINTDVDGKTFKIDIEEGTNFAPISFDYAGDEESDVAIMKIDFQGNLVEMVDEQNAN